MRRAAVLLGLAAGLALGTPRRARADGGLLPGFTGGASATAGYRLVDIDGAKTKYREDYNLRSGLRLFDLRVDGAATAPETSRLDRFRLEVETPGDEPVSRFRLSAADRALYDVRVAFTRSKYFYEVPRLFEAPVPGDVRLDDLHDFDLVRTNGSVDVVLRPPRLPTLLLGYRLYERHGDATSTFRIPAGDTFVVHEPVDTVTHVGRLGTEFRALGTDVFLQQEYRRVDRSEDLGPVLGPRGVDPADASTLGVLASDQDEHVDAPATTVRLRRPLGERAEVTGAYFFSHADLGVDLDRRRRGTSPVPAFSGAERRVADGDATLDTHVADLGGTVFLAERVRMHATYRFNDRSQAGRLDESSPFGTLAARTAYDLRAHDVTGDVEVEPRDDLSFRAGVRYGHRDADFALAASGISTDTVGAVGAVRYRPWSSVDLFARYENVQVDDPFVVLGDADRTPPLPEREIALTFVNRATAGLRLTPREWLALGYQLTADSRENETFDGLARAIGNHVNVTVTPLPALVVFAGYTRRDLDGEADIRFAPRYRRVGSVQRGSEDVLVSELRYDFTLARQPWAVGWDVAWVNVDETLVPRFEPGLVGRRAFDLDRIDGAAFVVLRHRLVEPSIEFRMIDYGERVLPRNDYRATILVFKLTKRWSW